MKCDPDTTISATERFTKSCLAVVLRFLKAAYVKMIKVAPRMDSMAVVPPAIRIDKRTGGKVIGAVQSMINAFFLLTQPI